MAHTEKKKWISMNDGNRVVTSQLGIPFKEAMVQAHTSDAAKLCPVCRTIAVVNLAPHLLAQQLDETTHVCHPVLGGCNLGFSVEPYGFSLVDDK